MMFIAPSALALRMQKAGRLLSVLMLSTLAQAAPTEGTSGQTVTGRSLHRHDAPPTVTASANIAVASAPTQSRPAWKDLSAAEQQALLPLAPLWDRLSEGRKRKWLLISKNYATLSPSEQAKSHRRMSEWAALSQQQRAQARQNYSEIKKLTPEQKAAEWKAYQALSAEEKRKLAKQAPAKPAGLAVGRPSATPKLTAVPRRHNGTGARMAEMDPFQSHAPRQEAPRAIERSPYEDEPADQ